jgi:hypothetical protein
MFSEERLVFSPVGARKVLGCRGKMTKTSGLEKSENISVMPLLSMFTELGVMATQIILKSAASGPAKSGKLEIGNEHIKMLTENIFVQFNHTPSSFQDGKSFITFLELVAKALDNAGVDPTEDRPCGLITDGHKSRYNVEAMRNAKKLNISLYFLPPHATTIY